MPRYPGRQVHIRRGGVRARRVHRPDERAERRLQERQDLVPTASAHTLLLAGSCRRCSGVPATWAQVT